MSHTVRALTSRSRLVLLLALALGGAVFFRCTSLGSEGFGEDEIDILRAVDAYRHFDFAANAEHPMVAKLAALSSIETVRWWNGPHLPSLPSEAALRFPMALTGALTTISVGFLALQLFGEEVAIWAALLWALDVNATAINRTAKEDTVFVFFLVTAAWLYARGKQEGRRDVARAQRWYVASGASFGLMLASKYMPHYFGMYALYNSVADPVPGENHPRKGRFYGALAAAFAAANFGLLFPASWRHILQYLQRATVVHTGYLFAHHLYVNTIDATPWGTPAVFYLVFLVTKTPMLVLAAFAAGLVQMMRRGQERGFVFTRIFLVLFLLPYSLIASKFVRYMLPLLVVVDILAAVGIVWILRELRRAIALPRLAVPAVGAAALLFVLAPLYAQVSSYPLAGLYQNAIGGAVASPGYFFSDDEFNDVGVREAVAAIARVAQPGAVIASDAETVVSEYLARSGRTDLRASSLSHDGLPERAADVWVIVQDGHVYFENEELIARIRQRLQPWSETWIHGGLAVQVFRLPDENGRALDWWEPLPPGRGQAASHQTAHAKSGAAHTAPTHN